MLNQLVINGVVKFNGSTFDTSVIEDMFFVTARRSAVEAATIAFEEVHINNKREDNVKY